MGKKKELVDAMSKDGVGGLVSGLIADIDVVDAQRKGAFDNSVKILDVLSRVEGKIDRLLAVVEHDDFVKRLLG